MHTKQFFLLLFLLISCDTLPAPLRNYYQTIVEEMSDVTQDIKETASDVHKALAKKVAGLQKNINVVKEEAVDVWTEVTDIAAQAKKETTDYVASTRLAQNSQKRLAAIKQYTQRYTTTLKEWVATLKNIKGIQVTFVVDQPNR